MKIQDIAFWKGLSFYVKGPTHKAHYTLRIIGGSSIKHAPTDLDLLFSPVTCMCMYL